jgi:hypothetical protein
VTDAKEKGDQREAIEALRAASSPEPFAGFRVAGFQAAGFQTADFQVRVLAVPISVLLPGFVLFCYTWRAKLGLPK